ncbi:MAG: type II toxin-antitoxin system RelE/ParE family toxin [Chloroflexi bacterium]|nr:type II toxin-antitoxin system RelE/ParE family toxin [Chloroflexota bacterium]
MYKIDLRRRAQRGLDRLPSDDFRAVLNAVQKLANNPRPRGVDKLRSAGGWWRVRQGDYRIIYDIDDDRKIVTVLYIGHRREIYRSL